LEKEKESIMKVCILEDSEDRVVLFKRKFFNYELYFFDNVEDAKKSCSTIDFDTYFLDHDLDDCVYVDSNEANTGYQFAKYLASKSISKRIPIYIHSLNPVGAKNMMDVLPQAVWIPFNKLIQCEVNL
jgi:hypothetical protein